MTEQDKLVLIQTLRRGNCLHQRRVNICAECLDLLERIVEKHKPIRDYNCKYCVNNSSGDCGNHT